MRDSNARLRISWDVELSEANRVDRRPNKRGLSPFVAESFIMVDANNIFNASKTQRKHLIFNSIDFDDSDDEIEEAIKISDALNEFLPEYFALRIDRDLNLPDGSVLSDSNLNREFQLEINQFKKIAIQSIRNSKYTEAELIRSANNLYEMSGAITLSAANKVTRELSTKMGLLWERLAAISPFAINPEIEFDIKVKGIDVIALNHDTGVIEYQQLKTQHNTLTGSQKGRSVSELLIHENPVFCACIANNSNWTFSHPEIPRVSGAQYWSRIGISYDIFLSNIRQLIKEFEAEFVS